MVIGSCKIVAVGHVPHWYSGLNRHIKYSNAELVYHQVPSIFFVWILMSNLVGILFLVSESGLE